MLTGKHLIMPDLSPQPAFGVEVEGFSYVADVAELQGAWSSHLRWLLSSAEAALSSVFVAVPCITGVHQAFEHQ